jgi:hypothetical protein
MGRKMAGQLPACHERDILVDRVKIQVWSGDRIFLKPHYVLGLAAGNVISLERQTPAQSEKSKYLGIKKCWVCLVPHSKINHLLQGAGIFKLFRDEQPGFPA